jgi:excisionase family DNA binding protein
MEIEAMVSVPEAAEIMRVSTWTVRGWLREGKLPKRRAGSRVLITKTAIAAFLEKSTQEDSHRVGRFEAA